MLWVTKHEPHLDICASTWLIKKLIDREAEFKFINIDDAIPEGAMPFVLPNSEINLTLGIKTTYDVLMDKYQIMDPVAILIQDIVRDFEINAGEEPTKVRYRETVGLFLIIRGLARISKTDDEILSKAFIIFDSLYAQLQAEEGQTSTQL